MEIKSDPFTEETVTDYNFTFTGGEPLGITLKERDYVSATQDGWLNVAIHDAEGVPGRLAINLSRVLWMDIHKRVVRTPITKPPVPDIPNPS